MAYFGGQGLDMSDASSTKERLLVHSLGLFGFHVWSLEWRVGAHGLWFVILGLSGFLRQRLACYVYVRSLLVWGLSLLGKFGLRAG